MELPPAREYGLTVADYRVVDSAEEGINAAHTIGYPLY
jgi:formate-dependent phosphoribosylglycinamide formyltransferase (GAR transformylase)